MEIAFGSFRENDNGRPISTSEPPSTVLHPVGRGGSARNGSGRAGTRCGRRTGGRRAAGAGRGARGSGAAGAGRVARGSGAAGVGRGARGSESDWGNDSHL